MTEISAIIDTFVSVWNGADLSLLDTIVDPGHQRISSPTTFTNADGLDDLKRVITETRTMMPDFHVSIEDKVISGNKSALRWLVTATHTGSTEQLAATGKSVSLHGISLSTYANGKSVEEWVAFDNLLWLVQLGLAEAPFASEETA